MPEAEKPRVFVPSSREVLLKGKLSTVDLIVLTGLDQLLFYWSYYLLFL